MTDNPPLCPPLLTELPYPVYFRIDDFAANSRFVSHSHPWGQLNYSAAGVMELSIDGQRFLSPPQYAVWIPPGLPHDAHIHQNVIYHSAYIDAPLCGDLPDKPCSLVLSPILKAILADFAERGLAIPATPADRRLADVLVDQLKAARCTRNYLPASDDPVLGTLLAELQREPGCNRSLVDWAARLHVTERTLARRCQRDLGMSFGEWRQRQRFLAALPLLEAGTPVQTVALELGYSTSSAFIAMFQRHSGTTPDQYRRQQGSRN
ncbi:helix-turn-helix transcriptional regulator [Crenobacter sp. SG2303]|uniref:Helix-turn-helix transcriptional regulator n=1 Tax=Crenobacter oryzisoli TaxID=3056844 RepID=A0ABT7XUD2_9NEIS|nr:helix-turn-helix transcriptional regulator [Crenobacter sp. SG2303]MDN0077396.1 helix-turn-helix transcriptional regulator [Crenobacter sp. SG2303]